MVLYVISFDVIEERESFLFLFLFFIIRDFCFKSGVFTLFFPMKNY